MGGLIYGWAYIRNGESVSKLVGLYMGGLIFGGGLYIRRFTVYNVKLKVINLNLYIDFAFSYLKKHQSDTLLVVQM